MQGIRMRIVVTAILVLIAQCSPSALAASVGTSFTYQGSLSQAGNPVNGSADVRVGLWDGSAGGATQIGTTFTASNITITNSVFSVDLDFGAGAFNGDERWLEIAVRVPHDPGDTQPFIALNPRQSLRPAPYAMFALGMDAAALPAGGAWTLTSNLSIDNATLYIDQASNKVGVGRVPTTNKFEVEGTASKATAGTWVANSDRRIKTNIQTIMNPLDVLNQVRLVSFEYTRDYRAAHPSIDNRSYLNVIAQEFEQVFPDDVTSSGEQLPHGSGNAGDDILQVDIHPLIIYSAAAIQELHAHFEAERAATSARLAALDAENAALRARLQKLEEAVQRLRELPPGNKP